MNPEQFATDYMSRKMETEMAKYWLGWEGGKWRQLI